MDPYLGERLLAPLMVAFVRLEIVVHSRVFLERRFLREALFAQLAVIPGIALNRDSRSKARLVPQY